MFSKPIDMETQITTDINVLDDKITVITQCIKSEEEQINKFLDWGLKAKKEYSKWAESLGIINKYLIENIDIWQEKSLKFKEPLNILLNIIEKFNTEVISNDAFYQIVKQPFDDWIIEVNELKEILSDMLFSYEFAQNNKEYNKLLQDVAAA